MVRAFADAGASVVAADVDEAGLSALSDHGTVVTVRADVSKQADVDALVSAAVRRFGQVDVLCNNAGITDRFLGVDECTDEEWERGLAVNLTGPFLVSRAVLPHMVKAGAGVVITTSSAAGLTGSNGGAMYGPDGICSVAICPGHTNTGQTKAMIARRESGQLSARSEATRARTEAAFLRRADPAELGRLALFIAAEGAPVLNGGVITADSGFAAF
jgi:NAD(P)-dependent dehydrogenase (short-subunit alcohol dehydrogenase family)